MLKEKYIHTWFFCFDTRRKNEKKAQQETLVNCISRLKLQCQGFYAISICVVAADAATDVDIVVVVVVISKKTMYVYIYQRKQTYTHTHIYMHACIEIYLQQATSCCDYCISVGHKQKEASQ